jgi:hypothetical protein
LQLLQESFASSMKFSNYGNHAHHLAKAYNQMLKYPNSARPSWLTNVNDLVVVQTITYD